MNVLNIWICIAAIKFAIKHFKMKISNWICNVVSEYVIQHWIMKFYGIDHLNMQGDIWVCIVTHKLIALNIVLIFAFFRADQQNSWYKTAWHNNALCHLNKSRHLPIEIKIWSLLYEVLNYPFGTPNFTSLFEAHIM